MDRTVKKHLPKLINLCRSEPGWLDWMEGTNKTCPLFFVVVGFNSEQNKLFEKRDKLTSSAIKRPQFDRKNSQTSNSFFGNEWNYFKILCRNFQWMQRFELTVLSYRKHKGLKIDTFLQILFKPSNFMVVGNLKSWLRWLFLHLLSCFANISEKLFARLSTLSSISHQESNKHDTI